jgi:hypothetical protein
MAQPIYKLWMAKYTSAWYELTKEEQDKHDAQLEEALKQVGGEEMMIRVSVWATEKWQFWGVEKFPSIEAVQQHAEILFNMNHYKYFEGNTILGIEMPEM